MRNLLFPTRRTESGEAALQARRSQRSRLRGRANPRRPRQTCRSTAAPPATRTRSSRPWDRLRPLRRSDMSASGHRRVECHRAAERDGVGRCGIGDHLRRPDPGGKIAHVAQRGSRLPPSLIDVFDLLRRLVCFARLSELKLQGLQSGCRNEVRMRRDRAIGQQGLGCRFSTVFLGEGDAQARFLSGRCTENCSSVMYGAPQRNARRHTRELEEQGCT